MVLVGAVAIGLVATACGGGSAGGGADAAQDVEDALYGLGTTQLIDCEALGTVPVSGVDRDVVRCSFEEEESGDGSMRQRSGCFVAENGEARDVTREVPDGIECVTSP